MKQLVTAVLICLAATGQASAGKLLYSGFATDAEGWSIGAFFAPGLGPLGWHQVSGGFTDGYIETTDLFGNNAFRAPASWLGDKSALFGKMLSFYERARETDGLLAPAVVLASGTTRLQYRAQPPGTDWTQYSVKLSAGEWEVGDGSGIASSRMATNAEILQVLSELDWIGFSADWNAGEDLVGFDEVSISSVTTVDNPEPSTVLTAVGGLAALIVAMRRRRA